MQEKEYAQVYEMGLGSLIGDFFQNVKDTVTGVARAVAPVAPYVLPFIPGIGPVAQLGIGAGLGLASGQKPSEVAKNLALQTALTGITGGFSKGATKVPVNTSAATVPAVTPAVASDTTYANELLGFFNDPKNVPGVAPSNLLPTGIEQVVSEPSFLQTAVDTTKDFFTEGIGSRLNPFSDASKMNPKFLQGLDMGFTEKELFKMGIKPERDFIGRIAPIATLASAALPFVLPKDEPEIDDTDYVQQARDDFYISYAADGGEMTGGVADKGQKIEHPNGKVKEHPKRIGEIAGAGTGTSDDIPAMLSDGEFVMTAQAVRNAGGGSRKVGAQNMYKLMKSLEKGGSLSEQSMGMVGRA
tara:strand:- start:2354 stop:3424 length:1071 start_codon:yes stop_codon:yes gene_type:complete